MPYTPSHAFNAIREELDRRPIAKNDYRFKAGSGRSQAFGVVNKRCMPPDYSRQCWQRPYLYKLLLDFGHQYVTDISWNAITVNMNYQAAPHRDRGNVGSSFLVAFGDFQGGELVIHEGDLSGSHDIRYNPLITDFSKVLHSVRPFTGTRYSLVFYKARKSDHLPPASVIEKEGRYIFKRGDEEVINGLPHPLIGYKHDGSFKKEEKPVAITFE